MEPWRLQSKRRQVFEVLGGRCECIDEGVCAGDRWECLQIDHRNGDGWRGKPEGQACARGAGVGVAYSELVRIGPHAFRKSRQLLCANCHVLKTKTDGYHLREVDDMTQFLLNQVEMF